MWTDARELTMFFLFWGSAGLLAYTYAGYPLLVGILARLGCRHGRGTTAARTSGQAPRSVTVVLVVRNGGGRIAQRIGNLLACDPPAEDWEIVGVSDGSTDGTASEGRGMGCGRVRWIEFGSWQGKAAGINAALEASHGEVVIFADLRQDFDRGTLRRLAAAFEDPAVGAVSGALEVRPASTGPGRGVDLYWRLERWLRGMEAEVDSSIGCTGAVYAIRRAVFEPLPVDTILDDVVIPMRAAVGGWRILFDRRAVAWDPQPLEPPLEALRKVRTLAGNFQMLFRHPGWMLPWRNRLWWQLTSHKYLRLLSPVLLVAVLVGSAGLASSPFYMMSLGLQCLLYAMAVLGLLARWRPFGLPAAFVLLNVAVVRGFVAYVRRGARGAWGASSPVRT